MQSGLRHSFQSRLKPNKKSVVLLITHELAKSPSDILDQSKVKCISDPKLIVEYIRWTTIKILAVYNESKFSNERQPKELVSSWDQEEMKYPVKVGSN